MNVAILNNSQQFAGTERHMLDLALSLPAQGIGVTLIAADDSAIVPHAKAAELQVITFRRRSPLSPVPLLKKLLRVGSIDLLHAHDGVSAMQSTLAIARAGRGFCIKTQHFIQPARLGRRGLKRWLSNAAHSWVNRRIDGCIAISHAARDSMLSRKDLPRGEIVVIHNGLSVPPASDLPPRQQSRAALNVTPDQILVLCLARLEQEKNVAALIEAMRTVSKAHPEVRCLIAGKGSLESVLRSQIQTSGLSDVVKLLGFRDDAYALLNAADLFVLPSLAEPFGLVLLEAMALSKPVVAVNKGGPNEIVVNSETGILASSPSATDIANAMSQILAVKQRWHRMGNTARQRYEQYFTTSRMAHATAKFYGRCAEHVLAPVADKLPIQPAARGNSPT
jgi:glycosyltransferase involved in cell wall biosynthesis